ncbi:hypothetical protein JD969_02250 [Planctomycetota bacterium]|nr:hypothetical protein JD969_02250 [Planctomycetota bacterium]
MKQVFINLGRKATSEEVSKAAKKVAGFGFTAMAVCGGILLIQTESHAALPDLGVDFGTMVSDMATAMGGYIGTVIGLAAAGIAALIGLKWLRRAG